MSAARRRPLLSVLVAMVTAAAFVLVGHALLGTVTAPAPAATGSVAASDLLIAWRRSLTTSWSVDEVITRTTTNGRVLTFQVHRAQRPPDHLVVGLGNVDIRTGDRETACATSLAGGQPCRSSAAPAFAGVVDGQVADLSRIVSGPFALYSLREELRAEPGPSGPGRAECFDLTLRLSSYPSPPYGRLASLCFDPSTGAPAGSTVQTEQSMDRTIVTARHAPALVADLVPPAGITVG